jgi:hypothetical protein
LGTAGAGFRAIGSRGKTNLRGVVADSREIAPLENTPEIRAI